MTNPNDPAVGSEHCISSGMGGTISPEWKHKGLTKRDYFAAMAMQGLLASGKRLSDGGIEVNDIPGHVSSWSVVFADALIEALNKTVK